MFKVGKNITVNADQVLEFRGLNDAGEEINIETRKRANTLIPTMASGTTLMV